MAIQKTLLDIVQEILSDMDADNVNSINDTDEAMQVANIVQNTYYDLVANRDIPELEELTKIDGLSDNTRPTYLVLPVSVSRLIQIEYNVSTTGGVSFRELKYKEPQDYLNWVTFKNEEDSNTQEMLDVNGETTLLIRNNKMPSCYTSFDDKHLVCDSFDSEVEDTLQSHKTRALVKKIPSFILSDTYTPDIDSTHFRFLVNEAKSTSMAILHKTVNPKVEQLARRQRVFSQNDTYRAKLRRPNRSGYGRT